MVASHLGSQCIQVGYVFRCVCLESFQMLGQAFSLFFSLSLLPYIPSSLSSSLPPSYPPSCGFSLSLSIYDWEKFLFKLLKLGKLTR